MSIPRARVGGEPADCPTVVRHEGGVTSDQALTRNTGTCRSDVKGGLQAARRRKEQSTDAEHRGGIEPSPIQLKLHQFLIEGVPVYLPVDPALLASLPRCDTVPPYPSRVRITLCERDHQHRAVRYPTRRGSPASGLRRPLDKLDGRPKGKGRQSYHRCVRLLDVRSERRGQARSSRGNARHSDDGRGTRHLDAGTMARGVASHKIVATSEKEDPGPET